MQKLVAVAADRIVRTDVPLAHHADDARALGVLDPTIWTEDDVLTGLNPCTAARAVGKFCCHFDHLRRGYHCDITHRNPDAGHVNRGQREASQHGKVRLAFHRVPDRRSWRRTSWHLV